MSTTDYPAPCRIVDKHGHCYRLQFRSHGTDATVGQLLAVADDDTEAQPIELTRDDVHQTDVDTEVRRWHDWHSTVRTGPDGFSSELSLTEVRRRFVNGGLHFSTDEA